MARGFGVAGSLDQAIVKEIAPITEATGFSTFWANDSPTGDGLESLAAAASVTTSIRLGVGVIPIDRRPAKAIIEKIEHLGLPQERLAVGIGAGGLYSGSIAAVRDAVLELKDALQAKVLVGALGPRMTALGGEVADGTLLNWLTPEYAAKSAEVARAAAHAAGKTNTHVAAYVRAAFGDAALPALRAEAARYATYPQYARNFARMSVNAIDTTVFGTIEEEVDSEIQKYEAMVDEIVVRAICAEEITNAYLAILHASKPR
jgi:alkanesulfonate monooxygenase SsuD/methylene tetrahydromethanopterin reductase-like flavin-dependent oxidoreductase (luciferase family)